jgi:protoporphyrinogen/coproporphyrinogen III oxidase
MADSLPALVIGAGISGLVCAHALRRSGIDVHVLEASPRPGGLIESLRQDGFLFELGPQSFSGTEALRQLCRDLGIEDQLLDAPSRAPRFVLVGGVLKAVPLSPPAFFASSFVSASTKWSILRDVFGRTSPPAQEESISAFVRRKFSAELLEKLVGPFVSGIYAGDPDQLSLRAAFPQLHEAEATAGSLVRGSIRIAKRNRKPGERRATLQTFREGNEALPQALAKSLGAALHLNARVTAVDALPQPDGFTIRALENGAEREFRARNLIVAVPTHAAAELLRATSPELSEPFAGVTHAPVAVVSLAYRKSDLSRGLTGFGFLIPRSAGLQVLGSVWNSSLFAERAPQDQVQVTSFVGGATNPAAIRLSPEHLADLVHREISPLLQAARPPVYSQVTLYQRALPQYNLGHTARIEAIEKGRLRFPGLFFTGNYLRGPAIGACVEQAQAVAGEVRQRLAP